MFRQNARQTQRGRAPSALFLTAILVLSSGSMLGWASRDAAAVGGPVRVIAGFEPGQVPTDADFESDGFEVLHRFKTIPAVALAGTESGLAELRLRSGFRYVEHDGPIEFHLETAVFATNAADVWAIQWWPVASEVQRKTPSPLVVNGTVIDGRGVAIGIADSGINAAHPDLWWAPGHNSNMPWEPKVLACVNEPTAPVDQPYCDQTVGHGTHVAGIAAGNAWVARNGLAAGVDADHPPMGVAPGASLVGSGMGAATRILNAAAALDWLTDNADEFGIRVINSSWGTTTTCANAFSDTSVNLIQNEGVAKGVVYTFSAGNYATVPSVSPTFTNLYIGNPTPGVIGVANYDDLQQGSADGSISNLSSDGCVASGGAVGDLLWTWPDVAAPGTSITSTVSYTGTLIPGLDGGFYGTASGTSMAAPHVAGVVALMVQANPDLTPAQIETVLVQTARPWRDGVGSRGISGSEAMWGDDATNNPVKGFQDPSLCKVSPVDAARAEAGDTGVNTEFPRFTEIAAITDADLFVCRDYRRGRGLVDAYAAVQEAIRLGGGGGGDGEPTVRIDSPSQGATVEPGPVEVRGTVDRFGTDPPNQPPSAVLGADPGSGRSPLTVTFTVGGSDADGTVDAWSLDFGDGSAPLDEAVALPVQRAHTYAADGSFDAVLTLTDDEGATGSATVRISVGGLPVPDGSIAASVFAFNEGGIGASNIVAIATGVLLSDDVPKYVAGETITMASRTTESTEHAIDENTPVSFFVFDEDGNQVSGPLATAGEVEDPTVFGCTCYFYGTGPFTIPTDWNGFYFLVPRAVVGGQNVWVTDVNHPSGLKKVEVISAAEPPPLPIGSPGPSDAGHTIGDVDNDATTPATEIQWADAALVPGGTKGFLRVVIKLQQAPAHNVGDNPLLYGAVVNGIDFEGYVLVGSNVWDNTNGADAGASTVAYDPVANTVTLNIDRDYLEDASSIGDCPCTGHVEARFGEGQLGGLVVDDRAPDAGSVPLSALLPVGPGELGDARFSPGSPLVQSGSEGDPEQSDPAGDNAAPFLDITKMWVSQETATTFDVTMKLNDLSAQPPGIDVGVAKGTASYTAEFCTNNNPNSAAYAAATLPSDGTFCWRFGATNALPAPVFTGGVIQRDGTGSCGLANLVQSGSFNVAADTVTWRLNKASFDVKNNSANVADCTATPIVRGGSPISDGTRLTWLQGRTGVSLGAGIILTFNVGDSTPSGGNARTYVFGQTVEPLVAEAGGPYSGVVGQPVTIGGSATGGQPPFSCAWTGPGTFADPGACTTTVAFESAGSHTITLTVQDGASATDADTATVDVGPAAAERVELFLDDAADPFASVPVSTDDANPTAPFSANADLAGLSGPHTLTARWLDADETLLDTHSVDITVGTVGGEAFVRIDQPGDDPAGATPLSGAVPVAGEAGHVGGGEAASEGGGLALRLRAPVVKEGHILAPCGGCEGASPALGQDLGTSVTWQAADPDGDTDGLDGKWLGVAGFVGASYRLDAEFGSPMDIWFFNDVLDAQSASTGSGSGPAMPKTGTVPPGSNWAFISIRRATTNLLDLQGFDDTAQLTLTPNVRLPTAPQLLEATGAVESVVLNWVAPADTGGEALGGYRLYRDGALVNTLAGGALSHTDTGLTAGQSYAYELSAVNSVGEGPRAGPVSATPLSVPPPEVLRITNPADGAVDVPGATTLDGTYQPRTGTTTPPPTGNFANTHYFFLLNLNSSCGGNLGYGDVLIASKLIDHAKQVLGMPPENVHFFNEAGVALNAGTDPSHFNQLPAEYKNGQIFEGSATLGNFEQAFEEAAMRSAEREAAGGPPARLFVLQSSHGFFDPANGRVFGSLMCLWPSTSVADIEFGTAITDALDAAKAATGKDPEVAIMVDCSFCGGFGDSPFWFPGTTTTDVDSAEVVGPNRVIEVGCTWITECFGNPAVGYDHIFNECTFTGDADGYGPLADTGTGGNPPPTGSGDPTEDVVLPNPDHHAKDGAISMEEAYWCALDSVKATGDVIGIQQMFQLVDQMDGDLFQDEGFVLWDISKNLDLGGRDPAQPLGSPDLSRPRTTSSDEEGDALAPFSDFVQIDAAATGDRVVVDMAIADLTLQSLETEDAIEFRVRVNGQQFGICYVAGEATVFDYDGAGDYIDVPVAYDFDTSVVHVELPFGFLIESTLPAEVFATSQYGECRVILPVEDDRVPDAGAIMTSGDGEPPIEEAVDEVRIAISGPSGFSANGVAALDAAAKTWTFDPAGTLGDGTYTATADQFFDDGSGFAHVEGPVSISFTVGQAPDTTPPTAPANLLVAGTTSNSASLAWDAASDDVGVARYLVYRAGAPGVPLQPGNLAGTTTGTTFTDSPLAADTDYFYVVVAEDAAGNRGDASNEAQGRTQALPPDVGTVTLRIDGTAFDELQVDLAAADPASWSTALDTAGLANGLHALRADFDDGRGGSASHTISINVQNGPGIAFGFPAEGAVVPRDIRASGTAQGAAPGATVQVRADNAGGEVLPWTDAEGFDGTGWSHRLEGLPVGALDLAARLRQGGVTAASAGVRVEVRQADGIRIDTVNGLAREEAESVPLDDGVPIEGSSTLSADPPGANVAPVARITDAVVVGRSLSASGALSYDADGRIVSHAWDLGNGDTRSGAGLAYFYATPGTFTLTLTVTDDHGATGTASFGPFDVATPPAGAFVVDAGDSRFVRIGDPLVLSATSFGAAGPVAYGWDTDRDGVPDRPGQTIQVDTRGLPEQPRTYTVFATDSTGEVQDSVAMGFYHPIVDDRVFTEFVPLAVNDEDADASGAVDMETHVYEVDVPAGGEQLSAFLDWGLFFDVVPDNPSGVAGGPNDFDLFVRGPDGTSLRSADFRRPEEVKVESPAAGTWELEVRSYLVAADTYNLFANVSAAPPSPLPAARQENEVCFETAAQTLVASATVPDGSAVTGAWDTDFDGVFDDGTGFEVTVSFPPDGAAHLVRFRATSDDGFRATALIGLRHKVDCPDAPGVVVVGLTDSGINPYHRDFAGELVPYPELREFTTADAEVALHDDALVRHKVSNAALPFTKHPSRFIEGFPEDARPLRLTLGGGFYKSLDNAAVWDRGHDAIPLGQWFWIPGTKIVGAMDTSDSAAINGAGDTTPLFDEDGHGTASASVAVGNVWGSCPRCVLVFMEGTTGEQQLLTLPWVDFISVSIGSAANAGTPVVSREEATKAAAERGQTVSYAAGNGLEGAFITPELTYTANRLGPDWTIDVGATRRETNGVVYATGKPVDWSSYGIGSIPAACIGNYAGSCGHSGTSAATPVSTGYLAQALLNVRNAIGDTKPGQKTPDEAGGVRQAVAVGDALPASPWLSDGVLQRHELWHVAFHCASAFGTALTLAVQGTSLPRSAVDYLYGGYGVADQAMTTCATNSLLTGAAVPAKPDADSFYEKDEAIRDALWGDWDGDGDGQVGGNENSAATVPAAPVGFDDVDTLAEATRALRDLYGSETQSAPPIEELHVLQREGCDRAGEPARLGDAPLGAEGCGVPGARPLGAPGLGAPSERFGSGPSAGFAAGALATGSLSAAATGPMPALRVRLLADGVEVARSPLLRPGEAEDGFARYDFQLVAQRAIPAGSAVELELFAEGDGVAYLGLDASHPSAFTLSGLPAGGVQAAPDPPAPASGPRVPSVEVQAVREGAPVSPAGWVPATTHDPGTGAWSYGWDTLALGNGRWDFHARLLADGTEAARDVFTADLRNSRDPVLGAIGDQEVTEGSALVVPISASDLDGDALALTASGVPDGASFTDHGDGTATLSWTPEFDDQGSYDITVQASDGGGQDSETFTLTVHDAAAAVLATLKGYRTVQGALDAAQPGDTVLAFARTHLEAPALRTAQVMVCGARPGEAGPGTLACATSGAPAVFQLPDDDWFKVTASASDSLVVRIDFRNSEGDLDLVLDGPSRVTLQDNVFSGGGVRADRGGSHLVEGNRFDGVLGTAVLLRGSQDNLVAGNRIEKVGTALALEQGSQPLGNVFRDNCIRGAALLLHLRSGVQDTVLDARLNDFGHYTATEVDARVRDDGLRNTVLTRPFLDSDCLSPILPPSADFTRTPADPVYAVVDTIRFTDASAAGSRPITSWAWGFGDGATSSDQDPSHVYALPGTYTVTLTVTDGAGLTGTVSKQLTLLRWVPPIAAFAAAPNPTDRLTDVQFTDQSTYGTGITQRLWKFGDGATSTEPDPLHRYATLGVFNATLTLTDSKNQVSSASRDIEVLNIPPKAVGSANTTRTDRLTPVVFSEASTDRDGTIASWAWAFGDGATSAERAPQHTYATLGDFAPSLTVTDNDGGTDTATLPGIEVFNHAPKAVGSANTTRTDRLTPVVFSEASFDRDGTGATADRNGAVASWLWAFGDGGTSTLQNPSYTYSTLGTFTPTLTVTDDDGATDTATLPGIEVFNLLPTAAFEWAPDPANRADATVFTDRSSDRDGTVAQWLWDFGDGATSSLQNPSHRFAQLGSYRVRLTVTDNDSGVSETVEQRVNVVNLLPVPAFDTDRHPPLAYIPTHFLDDSTDRDGSVVGWRWDFGDGFGSTERSPFHVYARGGKFNVTLTVTDNDSAASRLTKEIWVCAPGVQLGSELDLEHLHVETQGCIDIQSDAPEPAPVPALGAPVAPVRP